MVTKAYLGPFVLSAHGCLYGVWMIACKGAAAVFHMAAPDSSINSFNLHYSVSVEGWIEIPVSFI